MRMFWGALAVGAVLGLAPATASAGFLELANDEVSRDRHCDHNPCRRNGLVYKHRYVKGRYLRYEIETDRAEYGYKNKTIIITPPEIIVKHRPGEYDYHNGKYLVVATDKPTHEFEGPVTEEVEIRVLQAPAKHRVTRKRPYTAYYKDKAVVVQKCSMRDLFGFCLD